MADPTSVSKFLWGGGGKEVLAVVQHTEVLHQCQPHRRQPTPPAHVQALGIPGWRLGILRRAQKTLRRHPEISQDSGSAGDDTPKWTGTASGSRQPQEASAVRGSEMLSCCT